MMGVGRGRMSRRLARRAAPLAGLLVVAAWIVGCRGPQLEARRDFRRNNMQLVFKDARKQRHKRYESTAQVVQITRRNRQERYGYWWHTWGVIGRHFEENRAWLRDIPPDDEKALRTLIDTKPETIPETWVKIAY